MDEPTRWEFEVRVVTPDNQVLQVKQSFSSEYMDGSLFEWALAQMTEHTSKCLVDRGYFNG